MTAAIGKTERAREYFLRIISRAGCHPCDAAEAGRQLADLRSRRKALERQMHIYDGL